MKTTARSDWLAATNGIYLKLAWLQRSVRWCWPLLAVCATQGHAQTAQSLSDISKLQQQLVSKQTQLAMSMRAAHEHTESMVMDSITSMEASKIAFEDMRLVTTEPPGIAFLQSYASNLSKDTKGDNGELAIYTAPISNGLFTLAFFIPKGGDEITMAIGTTVDKVGKCSVQMKVSAEGPASGSGNRLNNGNGADCNSVNEGKLDSQIRGLVVDAVVSDIKSQVRAQASPVAPKTSENDQSSKRVTSQGKKPSVQESPTPTSAQKPSTIAPIALSGPDSAAIGNHARPCWSVDSQAEGLSGFSVLLQVTTDATGTVRMAEVDPKNTGDMSNPLYYAFTQRAIAAVLNAQCATLPLPKDMLGQNQTFSFTFTP